MTTTEVFTISDPRISQFLSLWHENGRASFEATYPSLDYDSAYYRKTAKDRAKFIALDDGTSGAFLLEKQTGLVYCIKGYGRVDKRKCCGRLDDLIAKYSAVNRDNAAKLQAM